MCVCVIKKNIFTKWISAGRCRCKSALDEEKRKLSILALFKFQIKKAFYNHVCFDSITCVDIVSLPMCPTLPIFLWCTCRSLLGCKQCHFMSSCIHIMKDRCVTADSAMVPVSIVISWDRQWEINAALTTWLFHVETWLRN